MKGATFMEKTLMLIKPDAVMRGHVGEIISRIENKGLTISAMKLVKLSEERARELYNIHEGKPFYEPTVSFMTSSPLVALAVSGPNVIQLIRKMIGATNPFDADPGSIRGLYAVNTSRNCVHASDSPESAQREIPVFFSENEILEYSSLSSPWI